MLGCTPVIFIVRGSTISGPYYHDVDLSQDLHSNPWNFWILFCVSTGQRCCSRCHTDWRIIEQELSSCWDARPCQSKVGRKVGAVLSLSVGELGPHLTQCRMSRGIPPYQVAS